MNHRITKVVCDLRRATGEQKVRGWQPRDHPVQGHEQARRPEDANRAHARLRSSGERACAQLKTWHILRKLRCCPWQADQLAKAIHVLQIRETGG
jgi:hypothetical protein